MNERISATYSLRIGSDGSNDAAGVTAYERWNGIWEVTSLWVEPDRRGQGLARRLLERLIADLGEHTLRLEVCPYGSEPLGAESLIKFYGRFGFKMVEGSYGVMVRKPACDVTLEGTTAAVDGMSRSSAPHAIPEIWNKKLQRYDPCAPKDVQEAEEFERWRASQRELAEIKEEFEKAVSGDPEWQKNVRHKGTTILDKVRESYPLPGEEEVTKIDPAEHGEYIMSAGRGSVDVLPLLTHIARGRDVISYFELRPVNTCYGRYALYGIESLPLPENASSTTEAKLGRYGLSKEITDFIDAYPSAPVNTELVLFCGQDEKGNRFSQIYSTRDMKPVGARCPQRDDTPPPSAR